MRAGKCPYSSNTHAYVRIRAFRFAYLHSRIHHAHAQTDHKRPYAHLARMAARVRLHADTRFRTYSPRIRRILAQSPVFALSRVQYILQVPRIRYHIRRMYTYVVTRQAHSNTPAASNTLPSCRTSATASGACACGF